MKFQPPFPENGNAQADAIAGVGIASLIMIFILFMIILEIYIYMKINEPTIVIIVYISCVSLSIQSLANPYFQIFSPSIQIFILLISHAILIKKSLEYYNNQKRNKYVE